MNENLDLTKILEGCPKGTKLYSSVYGEVHFKRIDLDAKAYPIITMSCDDSTISYHRYAKNGRIWNNVGECVLFPSKDQRDWSKFERFWDKPKVEKFDVNTLQPFDKVIVRNYNNRIWEPDLFGYIKGDWVWSLQTAYNQCIPYNEETKHLLGTANDCPDYYKWWEE